MAKINLNDVALPSEVITVDDVDYTVYALPATEGLKFMEQHQEALEAKKADLAVMKKIICMCVFKDGKAIGDKEGNGSLKFDFVFARKYGHLSKLYQEVLKYNFDDLDDAFGEVDTVEE